ncbi:MAG TPA: 2,3,4,5-tetrahydropyridine-2,6-dicarboxylate N-succinyltransferase [Holophaga sp.]|nr:2,3,4,5-tetrahydropyridine-2,6-dicarboxylate N-succinyltransferase [Holophaga sp.]
MNILAMNANELKQFFERSPEQVLSDPEAPHAHEALLEALESGRIRAAERGEDGVWRANAWVKRAILAGFRRSELTRMEGPGFPMFDKDAYPPRHFSLEDNVRLVPGGNAVRRGAYVAKGVVVMPPAYINVGSYVDTGTMVDSHALVGSCAQIGARVHLSAGAQVGGVLEPAGAVPVVVEDETFVGGLVGLFEGVVVRRRAVLASGVIITGSTVIYDLVNSCELRREVPEGAVVVPGSRPASGGFAAKRGLCLSAPMIVKYRDERTDAATCLEEALR